MRLYVPKWLQDTLQRHVRSRVPYTHHTRSVVRPPLTSPTQKALVQSLTANDQRRLERLTNEIENLLRVQTPT